MRDSFIPKHSNCVPFSHTWLISVCILLLFTYSCQETTVDCDNVVDSGRDDSGEYASLNKQYGEINWARDHGRYNDPVVLTGDELLSLFDLEPQQLVAFRYAISTGLWTQVPIQVDERAEVDLGQVYAYNQGPGMIQVYTDPYTLAGPDPDGRIDENDEVVFMARDAGDKPTIVEEPDGVISGTGVEVAIFESENNERPGYIYLFAHDGSLQSSTGWVYGKYTFSLLAGDYPYDYQSLRSSLSEHPSDLEDSWYKSAYYKHHFSDRWVSDVIEITTQGANGTDILDVHNIHLDIEECEEVNAVTLGALEGAFITNKSGPVRSIRSFIGARSGVNTQRTHLFYSSREDIITDLRVHPVGDGLIDYFDFSEAAAGMSYFSHHVRDGILVDGKADLIEEIQLKPEALNWETGWSLLSGEQDSLVTILRVHSNIDYLLKFFYRDQVNAQNSNCGGDESFYGANGFLFGSSLPCTEIGCGNFMQTARTLYFEEPGLAPEQAEQLSKNVYRPLEVSLKTITERKND